MTAEQKMIAELQEKLEARDAKIAEMEGDILTTVEIFAGALNSLGISAADFSKENGDTDLMQKIATILPRISFQFATRSFDAQGIQNVSALLPVFKKYEYLTENLNLNADEQS